MKVLPTPQVVFRRLGDRMVLIQLQTNAIFDLNETAARLWELVAEEGEVSRITQRLAAEYDVPTAELEREMSATLATFAANGLITGYAAG